MVIVEEAAEILEPSLLAALNPSVKHLILIGDHKQLPPQVDTYHLVKEFRFNTSMMERLIKSGYPFKMLKTQNRMLPEFSAMLKDIYPDLADNLARVSQNKTPTCVATPMFFWSHPYLEDACFKKNPEADRSKRNTKEAELVAALAVYFLQNGYETNQITILVGYLGQQKIVRSCIRKEKARYPGLFNAKESEDFLQVQTIDNYQGDENDIIIVSLVRANDNGKKGFLESLNRRCVAQSRAKCGMFFVGHRQTFEFEETRNNKTVKSVWCHVLKEMNDKNCVGPKIPLQCWKHKEKSMKHIETEAELRPFLDVPSLFCSLKCGDLFPCQLIEHACRKSCTPTHTHYRCDTIVETKFDTCGHPVKKRCHEDLSKLSCQVKVQFQFDKCGHFATKKCYVDEKTLTCQAKCPSKKDCQQHDCDQLCGSAHDHKSCSAIVPFVYSDCKHENEKKCSQPENEVRCLARVQKLLTKCKHTNESFCYKPEEQIYCRHPCKSKMSCNVHDCKKKCGDSHNHDICEEKINYKFPNCHHPSPKRKGCSEKIAWNCNYKVEVTLPKCNHKFMKQCYEDVSSIVCPHKPCGKLRSCGHVCHNACGEDCDKGNCKECKKIFEEKAAIVRSQAQKRVKQLEEELKQKNTQRFFRKELHNKGDTKAEYLKVEDMMLKYTQDMHNFFPTVTKIEKVVNKELELKFQKALTTVHGDHVDHKFHGTTNEGVEGIIRNGFRMPGPPKFGKRPGMFGQGIYFATDSSKSAQEIYTKNSNKLLLCKVLLGRSKEVRH